MPSSSAGLPSENSSQQPRRALLRPDQRFVARAGGDTASRDFSRENAPRRRVQPIRVILAECTKPQTSAAAPKSGRKNKGILHQSLFLEDRSDRENARADRRHPSAAQTLRQPEIE